MKVALIGYGKMGKAIEHVIHADKQNLHVEIAAVFTRDTMHTLSPDALKGCDVALEFTSPLTAEKNLRICIEAGIPVISGTTGWYAALPAVEAYCLQRNSAMLCAANFSIGVHLFLAINRRFAEIMQAFPQYDVHLEETHHVQKTDAPSGTAIRIAETILPYIKGKNRWVLGEQNADAISITAHRIDKVPGTHVVKYESAEDAIHLTHTAHSRMGFATGAWHAAQWIIGKKGVFTMEDVLGKL